jgi:hypothetical protein
MAGRFVAVLLLAAASRAVGAPRDALVFVSQRGRPETGITSGDLRRMYLGQLTRWRDGHRVVLAVRPDRTLAGKTFFDRVVEMPEIDFSRLWLGILFRGDAVNAPRVVSGADDLKRFLARTPDALGFLLASEWDAADPSMQALAVDGSAPGAPAYPYRLDGSR